jgi:hypothetical protein
MVGGQLVGLDCQLWLELHARGCLENHRAEGTRIVIDGVYLTALVTALDAGPRIQYCGLVSLANRVRPP